MRARARPFAFTTLLALAAIALLAACGDDDGAASGTPRASATATVEPARIPIPDAPFDAAAALAHVRALSGDIGIREAGSDGEREAAAYLLRHYEAAGYDAELQPFDFAGPLTADVHIGASTLDDARAMAGSAAATASGPLAYIGLGRSVDIAGSLAGQIAVAERGEIAFGVKAQNAERAGAVALIIINTEDELLFGRLEGTSTIPVAGVPRGVRAALLDGAALGNEATVAVEGGEPYSSQNVVARPPGGESCDIVAGGHYDSVPAGPGANDNASGTAVTLAVAETRATRGQLDGICYVAFGAEETGLHGSLAFVEAAPASERAGWQAMLNLDQIGHRVTWELIGTADMQQIALEAAAAIGLAAAPFELPDGFDSDHSPFENEGVPVLFLHGDDDDVRYHTADDTSEFVQREALDEAGRLVLALIARLRAA